jgi:hypothetical protein
MCPSQDGGSSIAGKNKKQKQIATIYYWRKADHWPNEYFEQDDQSREDCGDFDEDSENNYSYERHWAPETNMNPSQLKSEMVPSLGNKELEAGLFRIHI